MAYELCLYCKKQENGCANEAIYISEKAETVLKPAAQHVTGTCPAPVLKNITRVFAIAEKALFIKRPFCQVFCLQQVHDDAAAKYSCKILYHPKACTVKNKEPDGNGQYYRQRI
jgi:hypothetical protein